jgi:hypothetical protein
MTDIETIKRLEQLAAWHRINADHAGADWVWQVRLRTAEDLEQRAAELRHRLLANGGSGHVTTRGSLTRDLH